MLKGNPKIPPLCPSFLAGHLLQCWAFEPKYRPSFDSLLRSIEDLEMFKSELQNKTCCQDRISISSNNCQISANSVEIVQYTEVIGASS